MGGPIFCMGSQGHFSLKMVSGRNLNGVKERARLERGWDTT